MAKTWERQPDESEEAYEAFRIYLELGVSRTQLETCRRLGKNRTTINEWANKYEWNQRAVDYENWINAQIDKKLVNEAWKTKKEHTKVYANLRNIAQFPISQLADRIKNLDKKDEAELSGMSLKQLYQ